VSEYSQSFLVPAVYSRENGVVFYQGDFVIASVATVSRTTSFALDGAPYSLAAATAFTLAFFINPSGAANKHAMDVGGIPIGRPGGRVALGPWFAPADLGVTLAAGVESHVAMAVDLASQIVDLYLDGQFVRSAAHTYASLGNSFSFGEDGAQAGSHSSAGNVLRDVRLYNRAIAANEARAIALETMAAVVASETGVTCVSLTVGSVQDVEASLGGLAADAGALRSDVDSNAALVGALRTDLDATSALVSALGGVLTRLRTLEVVNMVAAPITDLASPAFVVGFNPVVGFLDLVGDFTIYLRGSFSNTTTTTIGLGFTNAAPRSPTATFRAR
jgi:hypothetical protein